MTDDELLTEITHWVAAEVETSFPRGFGACMWASDVTSERYGFAGIDGLYVDDPDDLPGAIASGRIYTHGWNVRPDGSIVDATAGQFHADGPVARIIGPDDPDHRHYLTWEQIAAELHDAVDDAVQASYPDPT
jgi:hypothetical protein